MKGSLMESFNSRFDKKLNESFKIISSLSEYEPWSGAVDTWNKIVDADKVDEFEDLMEMEYPDGLTVTSLNDALWFDGDQILSDLGISDYPKTIKVKVWGIEYEDDIDQADKPTEMEVEVEVEDEHDDIREKVHDAIYDELPTGIGYFDISDFEFEEIVEENLKESSTIDKIDADADDKKEKLKAFMKKKIDDIDADRDDKKEKLKESDKPAATSIEDAQKWVDYDMKKYGKISERTNRLVRKAGFQIVKDTYGDYEVIAGKYDESVGKEKYYFVEDDSWGQRGTFIETLYLTKEEADKVKKTRTHNGKRGFFTKDYEEALYYTQD